MAMAHDVILWKKMREKDVVGIVTFDLIGLLPTNHINLLLILQWHIEVCEETFNDNSNYSSNIWNLIVRKLKLQEMANFDDYPEDFRL